MSDSNEGKGPLAAVAGILAVAGLGLKAGCAKLIAGGGDDAFRAASHSAPALGHSGEEVVAGARAAGTAAHGEESLGAKIGKDVLKTGVEEGVGAAYDAYEDGRATSSSPAPRAHAPNLRSATPTDGIAGRPVSPGRFGGPKGGF